MSSNVIMYVKGLSRGNPGPSGIGIIVCDHWGRIVKKIGESIGVTTGAYSEFRALLRGIEEIRNLNAFRVKVLSDSEAVIRHMTGISKVKGDDLAELLEQIRALSKGIVMEFIQIHPIKNREAENLAREALEKQGSSPQRPSQPQSSSPQPAAQAPLKAPSQAPIPGGANASQQGIAPTPGLQMPEKNAPPGQQSPRGEIDIRMIKAAVQRAMLLEEFTKAPEERTPLSAPPTHAPAPPTHAPAHPTHAPASPTHAAAPQTHAAAPQTHAAAPQTRTAAPQTRAAAPQTHAAAHPTHAPAHPPTVPPPPPPERRVSREQSAPVRDRLDNAMAQSSVQPPSEDLSGEDCLEEREERQISAGGVVYKKEGGRYKICLVAKKNKRVWALPKGRLNPGENLEETAQREIAEETGLLTEVHEKLDEISYYFYWKDENVFYHKTVYFYMMPVIKENYCQRDTEVDAVIWLTLGEAYKKLTYLNEKEVMKKAQKILKSR
ncbi:MAG: NUDIX domain-containing protein [Candidatus Xenobiia bacterium LiM19]